MNDLQYTPSSSFLSEYLNEVKEMINEFRSEFSNEFKGKDIGVTPTAKEKSAHFPLQLWETHDKYYVLIFIPGVKSKEDVKVTLINSQTLYIQVYLPSFKPSNDSFLIHSEILRSSERSVLLPESVLSEIDVQSLKNGIFTVILNKSSQNIEIPIDF
ncbi:MAG: Hsp20/alpha crystallin family protein [Bacillota bacterium]